MRRRLPLQRGFVGLLDHKRKGHATPSGGHLEKHQFTQETRWGVSGGTLGKSLCCGVQEKEGRGRASRFRIRGLNNFGGSRTLGAAPGC